MTKKKIAQTFFIVMLGIGSVWAEFMDPHTRMEKIKDLFTQYGVDTFKLLNGQDIGGTARHTKGLATSERGDIASVVKPNDGQSFIFCVADSKWVVYPPEPMKVGTNAMTATDANGRPFVETMIAALRNSLSGKAYHIRYDVVTPDGRLQAREATVWNSKQLLNRENDTGQKFFCGTSVKATP